MQRFRRLLLALSALLLVGGVMATPAFAWPDRLEGKPDSFDNDARIGYYIWRDDDGLHLRTTGPGPRHIFKAKLTTDGSFSNARLIRLEGDDWISVRDGGQTLITHFETFDGVDGVDFGVDGGSELRLKLKLDGQLIPTSDIYLGDKGAHPSENPFVLKR